MAAHNKLMRDLLFEIIEAARQEYAVEVMTDPEFQQALWNKFVEEAQEAAAADSESLIQELADLYEVFDTLIAAQHISRENVLLEQGRRRIEQGGFAKQLKLVWSGAN